MKKLLFFFLMLHKAGAVYSQVDSNSFKAQWDKMFSDFSPPSGYLWDKGLPDSSVWYYKGQLGDSVAGFNEWSNTYQYWINSSQNPGNSLVHYDSIKKRLDAYFNQGISVIPLLHIYANRISQSAFDSSKFTLDSASGKFIINNTNNLLDVSRTVMAAPFIPTFFDSIAKLYFGNDFYYTNTGTSITGIRIRLNNGAWSVVTLGSVYTLNLSKKGSNLLTIEYTLDNNEVYYTETGIVYSDPLNGGNKRSGGFHFGDGDGNIYATPVRTTEKGTPLGAFIDCVPGKTNGIYHTNIMKPIIFVEGIDFGYKDHPTGCYGGKCGHLGLKDLVAGEIYNPYEAKYKNWYEAWDPIKKAPQLIAELQKKGYDIIYIDFHNGTEFIENNAMLLVELIKQVNNKKITNEEVVVMGASMGGLISRYALSYMEKNNMPHCTRTYLAFDSPQQGANIPLGMQYQVAYYNGKLPTVNDTYKRKLDRAATKQLLVYHFMSGEPAGPHDWRKDFVKALASVGNYPAYTRNIALVNGSVTGGNQGYEAGAKLLSMNPYGSKLFPGGLQLTSKVYACYYVRNGEPIVQESSFPLKGTNTTIVPSTTKQYDHSPGGKRFDLRDSRLIGLAFNVINHQDAACFIPTTSSLDVKTSDLFYNVTHNIDKTKPEPSKYPFHTFYGPQGGNEEHSQITDVNLQWVVDELEKNQVELPVVLNKVYNYGQYERFLFRSTKITSGGKLQFNGNYNTGFGTGPYDKMPKPGSVFEAYTTDCSPLVTIEAGGQMVLGDNNSQNNRSVVHFRKGSTLVIKAGGILRIHNHSQLIIEDGAKLVYYPGAKIILDGEDAVLQMDGTLRLESNAVFSIDRSTTAVTGYIKYRNVGPGSGRAKIEVVGMNTSINLDGSGKLTDHLLQVEGEMILPNVSPNTRLKELRITNCMVMYANNSRIITQAAVYLQESKFGILPAAAPHTSDALWFQGMDNCFISSCLFTDMKDGVRCSGGLSPNNLHVEYTTFDRCNYGFTSVNRGVNMTGNIFTSCYAKGAEIVYPANDSKISECQFKNNSVGLDVSNTGFPSRYLFVLGNTFQYNQAGLEVKQCNIAMACSRFINNRVGATVTNGELNISRVRISSGNLYSSAGGNNTFAYNYNGLKLAGPVFFMNDGYNNFIQTNGMAPYQFITGDIAYSTLTHFPGTPYPLRAANNYWQPAPASSLMNGAMSHYFVTFPFPGGASTMNYFSGTMLPAVNALCYKPGCNPCDQVVTDGKGWAQETLKESTAMVNISPYPVSDELKIELKFNETEKQFRFRLISLEGKVLWEANEAMGMISIDASGFAEGMYLLEISSNERREVQKILIRR